MGRCKITINRPEINLFVVDCCQLATPPPIRYNFRPMKLLYRHSLTLIVAYLCGCSAFETTRIEPVFDPEASLLPRSSTIAYVKNGIVALAVPLNDVKAADAFAIIIYNGTDHFISLRQKDCWMLDGTSGQTKPIHRSMYTATLGKNYKPTLPPEFKSEVFRWNRSIHIYGDTAALPTEDIEKTRIMPKQKSQFF